ncbi:MAG: PEP-CTERM sorting domain-containing protein [Alphaproteobacteria bacterium]|nr:PEP-CTERM sorting domain-containing protein [Alphaproteobacteria bacterium]
MLPPPTPGFYLPGILVAPPLPGAPPPPPPCDKEHDKDCKPPPPPPPHEAPEPGTLFIMLAGAAAIWFARPRRKRATARIRA